MKRLDAAGVTPEQVAAYLQEHPGIDFDEAITELHKNGHTVENCENCEHEERPVNHLSPCFRCIGGADDAWEKKAIPTNGG